MPQVIANIHTVYAKKLVWPDFHRAIRQRCRAVILWPVPIMTPDLGSSVSLRRSVLASSPVLTPHVPPPCKLDQQAQCADQSHGSATIL
jgi:hypothetical protein